MADDKLKEAKDAEEPRKRWAIGPEPYCYMTPAEYNEYVRKAIEGNG